MATTTTLLWVPLVATILLFSCLPPQALAHQQKEDQKQKDESLPILVVGASGMTGRHVVQQLLDKNRTVRVIVRSKERMLQALPPHHRHHTTTTPPPTTITHSEASPGRLIITEATLLEMSDEELEEHVVGVGAVVQTLGHTIDMEGLFGEPRRLCRDSAQRLTRLMTKTQKFILMSSDGIPNPNNHDNTRSLFEQCLSSLLHHLLPPHTDNEEAANYVYSLGEGGVRWGVVRPTDLVDGVVSEYEVFDKPQGSLFGGGVVRRSNVAAFMVALVSDEEVWERYKFTMPVIHDVAAPEEASPTPKNEEL